MTALNSSPDDKKVSFARSEIADNIIIFSRLLSAVEGSVDTKLMIRLLYSYASRIVFRSLGPLHLLSLNDKCDRAMTLRFLGLISGSPPKIIMAHQLGPVYLEANDHELRFLTIRFQQMHIRIGVATRAHL